MADPYRTAAKRAGEGHRQGSCQDPNRYWDLDDEADRERVLAVAELLVSRLEEPLIVWAARRGQVDTVLYLIATQPEHVRRYGAEAIRAARAHGRSVIPGLLESFLESI